MRTIVWFRGKDLRLSDHKPLQDALDGGEVIPLFVLDPYFFTPQRAAELPHRMQFLLQALRALADQIRTLGSQLVLVEGRSVPTVPALLQKWGADRVVAHRWVEPFGRKRDAQIRQVLGARFQLYEGETLIPPGTLRTGAGKPYSVFTPFSRTFRQQLSVGRPIPVPDTLPALPRGIKFKTLPIPILESIGLVANPRIQQAGSATATARLERFIDEAAHDYHNHRDRMDLRGTSRLSADLKFGTLSVREVWHGITSRCPDTAGVQAFLNELIWRDFSHSTLWDRPELLQKPFRQTFDEFPWREDETEWQAWVCGATGYPVVDAASRQLLAEGFVHNRARMITASFLTKHLMMSYQQGERHFLKYLTDGDWAQNNAGWQWSAGCGCDAQPYFRIFNPVTQGRKFDPEGHYVRQWVPELARLPKKHIHAPWEAPEAVLQAAGVRLEENYPRPLVDHRFARERYLATAKAHLNRRPAVPR